MWSWSTNVTDRRTDGQTDRQTDGQHAISIPRYALVHRAVIKIHTKLSAGSKVLKRRQKLTVTHFNNVHCSRINSLGIMLKRSQTLETNGVRQTVPHTDNSTRKETYSDFVASRFIQLTRMPSRPSVWNIGVLKISPEYNFISPWRFNENRFLNCFKCRRVLFIQISAVGSKRCIFSATTTTTMFISHRNTEDKIQCIYDGRLPGRLR